MLTSDLAFPLRLMPQKVNARRQQIISMRGFVLNYESNGNQVAPEADRYGCEFNINCSLPALFCRNQI